MQRPLTHGTHTTLPIETHMQTHTHTYRNAKSADRRRMMDERSWASKMGEEDDESARRWCVGRRRCVSLGAMVRELRRRR